MELRVPNYYSDFHCLAGACPHSCCIGWEVVIDSETAAAYRAQPGPFGDKLRRSMREEDGEASFALDAGDRCPFLDGENLCRIHRLLGAEKTSRVCREHPRFLEDYGTLQEISLCASCPAVNRLLLGSEAPLTFRVTCSQERGEPADPWLEHLLICRERTFAILQDRSRPLYERLTEMLLLADSAQALLDLDAAEELPELCREWRNPTLPEVTGTGLFPEGWAFLEGLEILGEDWRDLLQRAKATHATAEFCPDWMLERIVAYFLFRYFLKAVGDGDLLSRVELSVFSAAVLGRLGVLVGLEEALRLWCREIEHCEENLDALQTAFCSNPSMSLGHFMSELGTMQHTQMLPD